MNFYPFFVSDKEKARRKRLDEKGEEFGRQMEEEKVTLKEKLVMIFTAYVVLVLPAILFLLALLGFMLWVFGIL